MPGGIVVVSAFASESSQASPWSERQNRDGEMTLDVQHALRKEGSSILWSTFRIRRRSAGSPDRKGTKHTCSLEAGHAALFPDQSCNPTGQAEHQNGSQSDVQSSFPQLSISNSTIAPFDVVDYATTLHYMLLAPTSPGVSKP
jgi:hypothetical protein